MFHLLASPWPGGKPGIDAVCRFQTRGGVWQLVCDTSNTKKPMLPNTRMHFEPMKVPLTSHIPKKHEKTASFHKLYEETKSRSGLTMKRRKTDQDITNQMSQFQPKMAQTYFLDITRTQTKASKICRLTKLWYRWPAGGLRDQFHRPFPGHWALSLALGT